MSRWGARIMGLILLLMFMFLFLNLKKQLEQIRLEQGKPPAAQSR
jgi:hypothetical protein